MYFSISGTSLKWLISLWVAAAVVLLVSIGGTVAQPNSQPEPGETADQQKNILILHSYGPSFQPWATWSREIGRELNRQSPWPPDIQEHSVVTARGATTLRSRNLPNISGRSTPDDRPI